MRAAFGKAISPASGTSSPRISLNSVVFPIPLRPTSPTLAPTGSDTLAESKKRRFQALNTRLSIWSIGKGRRRVRKRLREGEGAVPYRGKPTIAREDVGIRVQNACERPLAIRNPSVEDRSSLKPPVRAEERSSLGASSQD